MTPPTIKFLLVDDLEGNLLALEALLKRDGLELLKARSGFEALELLLVHDVSLALLDVQMAGMDGFELAELMRGTERTRRVPIIFVTAGAIDQQRHFRGYEAGAVDFIFKPIEPHILKSKAGIFFDLAMQREALRQNMEEARAANRAKDDFLAALSHELRTPLTPVLMGVAALQEDASLPADAREQLIMMRRNIELEARLIDDLLDVTRISHGKLTIEHVPVDIHDLLRHCHEIIRSDGPGKNVDIVFDVTAARHHVLGDPARLHQVFWNLLKNAFKFTAEGGTITVRTRNCADDHVTVSVADTGVGISAEAMPHIFSAFEQGDVAGKHRFGGLGLGLTISKAIVDAHHGTIQVASPGAGRGATFTVTLATADAPGQAAAQHTTPPPPVQALRLLVVEDHAPTRDALTRLLTRSGHRITAAGSRREGIAAYETGEYDVVISDLGLPDGSGLDLMRSLQAIRPVIGIALSGYGTEEDVRQAKEAGFHAHLTKPVKIEQLRHILAELPVPP